MQDLKPCPSCKFDKNAYAKHREAMDSKCGSWDSYCPQVFYVFGIAFVECPNCGFMATWCDDQNDKANTISQWNKLPR